MSDVTVVALTIGEPYRDRALASAARQTVPPAATVVVRDVTPFHRALNAGAAQVRTPFFIQLDADVILDDTCLETLRALMAENVSIASGLLRDPIVGRTTGVRLYRTACFETVQIRDSISPDLDFTTDTARLGWIRRCALRWPSGDRNGWHTVGDHRPDYTPLYTFSKFRLEGIRARYRRREGRAALMLGRLCASTHSAAPLALIATAHGLFDRDPSDQLAPYRATPEFDTVHGFLADPSAGPALGPWNAAGAPPQQFRDAYAFAVECRRRGATAAFLAGLAHLKAGGPNAWIPLTGLCHGVFAERFEPGHAALEYAALREVL